MKKHLMIPLLATGFALVATGVAHASSANACAVAQATQTLPASDSDIKSTAAAAASPSSSKRAPMSPFAARVQEAITEMPNELCGICDEYAKPTALVFRNELPESTFAFAESKNEVMTVEIAGLTKEIPAGQEVDLAHELGMHQLFTNGKDYTRFTVEFWHPKKWGQAQRIHAVNKEQMWQGRGFKLVQDPQSKDISVEEFVPEQKTPTPKLQITVEED